MLHSGCRLLYILATWPALQIRAVSKPNSLFKVITSFQEHYSTTQKAVKIMDDIIIDRKTGEVRDPPGRLTDEQIDFWSDLLVEFITSGKVPEEKTA